MEVGGERWTQGFGCSFTPQGLAGCTQYSDGEADIDMRQGIRNGKCGLMCWRDHQMDLGEINKEEFAWREKTRPKA